MYADAKKSVGALVLAVFLLAAGAAGFGEGSAEASAPQEIHVGFFGPLSGDNAEYGKTFQRAIDLYVSNLNDGGGIGGRPVRIDAQDDRADPQQAANIARRFVSDSNILAVVGSFSSAASMAAAPIFQEGGLTQVSPTSSHPDFTKLGSYMFRIVTTQDIEGPLDAQFLVDRFDPATVAVIYRQDDWGVAASDYFTKKIKDLGVEVTISEPVAPGTKDFRPLVTTLSSRKPDVLFLALFYADAATLARQMQQAGLSVPVVTNSSLFNPQLIELAGGAVNGWYVPSNFAPDSDRPVVKQFVQAYRADTGEVPDQFAALAYDAIGVVTQALKNRADSGKDLTRAGVRDALAAISAYNGVTGRLRFDAQGNALRENMTWLTIANGQFQVVKD